MELLQTHSQAFVVAGQAFVAGAPTQAALHHPAAGQQYKAAFGLPELHDLQVNAVFPCRLCRHVTGIALVGVGQRNALTGRELNFFGQQAHLGPVLFVGRRHDGGEPEAERVDGHVHLAAFAPLGPVVTGTGAAFQDAR